MRLSELFDVEETAASRSSRFRNVNMEIVDDGMLILLDDLYTY